MADAPLVLITGITGFVGSVVAAYTLAAGYRVRGTVRDVNSSKLEPLKALQRGDHLTLVKAELDKEDGWKDTVKGVTYILHVASPVPTDLPKDAEKEVIQPAIAGVLNVLRAAAEEPSGSVKRVVLTSSVAAVNEGRTDEWRTHTFTEDDWSKPEKSGPYPVSKTRAEQAAWSFMQETRARPLSFDLAVVNPGLIIGPPATPAVSSSTIIYTRLFSWGMPAVPDLCFWAVDVRDVALGLLKAMIQPEAGGKRYLLVAGEYHFRKLAADLAAEFTPYGISLPTWPLPSWIVRILALFDGALAVVAPMLGNPLKMDNSRARTVLGLKFRDLRTASIQGAYALLARGVLPDTSKGKAVEAGSSVPKEHWISYEPAPAGTPPEEAGRYAFTADELDAVRWKGIAETGWGNY